MTQTSYRDNSGSRDICKKLNTEFIMMNIKDLQDTSSQTDEMKHPSRVDLEKKIQEMWKNIEDLKQKVAQEKLLLLAEKSENERMIQEQGRLKRKLSMFHLPQCRANYTASDPIPIPCPVHPHGNPAMSDPEEGVANQPSVRDSAGHSFQGDCELHTCEKLFQCLKVTQIEENEDLFSNMESSQQHQERGDDATNRFTLSMTKHWEQRKTTLVPTNKKDSNIFKFDEEMKVVKKASNSVTLN